MTVAANRGRDARLLADLAAPLEPAQAPTYVSTADSASPDGWYWTPADADRASYLGRNVNFATRRLITLLGNAQR